MQLGYLNFQAKGQVPRLLCAYTHQQFQDKFYTYPEYHQVKQSLGFDFPNLPYLIDGKIKITQHAAIQRYIILKSKKQELLGLNSKEKGLIDNVKGVLVDINNILIPTILNPSFRLIRKESHLKIKTKLDYIQNFVGVKKYLLNKLSYADFHLAVCFSYYKVAYPSQAKNYKNILRIVDNFNKILQIQQYYRLQNCVKALFPQNINLQNFNNLQSQQQMTKAENITEKQEQQHKKTTAIEQKVQQKTLQDTAIIKKQQEQKQTEIKQIESLEKQTSQTSKQKYQRPIESKLKQYLKKAQSTNSKSSGQMLIQKSSGQVIKPSQLKNAQSKTPWINAQKSSKTQNKSSVIFGRSTNQSLAQRLLLQYFKVDYKQVIYESQQHFNKDLSKLSLDFSTLPYLIDDGLNISSSLAIDRYIIRKFGNQHFMGKQLIENAKTQNLVKLAYDLIKQLKTKFKSFSKSEWQKAQSQKLFKIIGQKLNQINLFIGKNVYAMGYLTFADFLLTQLSFQIKRYFSEEYSKYEFFQRIKKELCIHEKLKILIQQRAETKN